jgi:tetratricopeptide (TPR) repeat protein
MRLGKCGSGGSAMLVLGVLLVLGVAGETTALGKGKVSGKVVDAEGKAVSNVTLRFTLDGTEDAPRTIDVRKKGRFNDDGLAPGRYRIDLDHPDLYVSRVEFDIRNDADLRVGSGQIDGHPRSGVTGVPVSERNEVRLIVVLASRGSAESRERELSLAAPELSTAAKHYNRAEYEQAVAEASRVLAERAELGEAYYILGLAQEKLAHHVEAESALMQAIERMPDYPRIWAALGEVRLSLAAEHESRDETDAARDAFGRAAQALTVAIEHDPETLSLQINLAAALDRTGDDERLLQTLERILEQDPTHLPSRLRLAGLYSSHGEHDRALALLDEIPTSEKRVAVTIYNIAVGLNEDGEIDGSLLLARRAAEIDPQMPQPRRLIAQILLGKNDPPAAIEAIRIFLELAPDDPEADVYRRILEQLEQQ